MTTTAAEITTYLSELPNDYVAKLEAGRDELASNGSFAWRKATKAADYINIPVATPQEAGYLGRALGQFALQQSAPPHRVALHLTCPVSEIGKPEAEANMEATMRVIDDINRTVGERLPFSWMFSTFEDLAMGALRGQVTDSSLLTALRSLPTPELNDLWLHNHDADLAWLHPSSLHNLRRTHQANRHLRLLSPATHHDLTNQLPNIDATLAWFNITHHWAGTLCDTGNSFSAQAYAKAKGYNQQDIDSETHNLMEAISKNSPPLTIWQRVPSAPFATSNRRLVARLLAGQSLTNPWAAGEFPYHQPYRTMDIAKANDITPEERDKHIHEIVLDNTKHMLTYLYSQRPHLFAEGRAEIAVLRRLKAAEKIIGAPQEWRKSEILAALCR